MKSFHLKIGTIKEKRFSKSFALKINKSRKNEFWINSTIKKKKIVKKIICQI